VLHARASGEGQHVDAGLLQAQVAMLANHATGYLNAGKLPPRSGNRHATVVPYRDFEAKDGTLIVAVGSDSQFAKLCAILGRGDLAADPRFARNAGRQVARAELEAILEAEIATWERDLLLRAMEREGVPGGPINDLAQLFADPQVEATGLVVEVERSGASVRLVRYPQVLSATPASVRHPPPRLGEHSRLVLGRELGLEAAELDRLEAAGVIVQGA
jgi:crotonobetainyl-CoA:carnitine CoA-transferase CaiB-like acyl-CoA transferase